MRKISCICLFLLFFCQAVHADQKVDTLKDTVCTGLPIINGWCSQEKAINFIDLVLEVKPQVCVEIGVFGGKSVFPVAMALNYLGQGTVYAVDPWDKLECIRHFNTPDALVHLDWWNRVDLERMYQSYLKIVKKYDLEKRCKTLRMTAAKAEDEIPTIDILYLDAIYSNERLIEDITLYLPKVRSGGYIWLNDTLGVNSQEGVDLLMMSCEVVKIIDSGNCVLFKKI